MSDPTPDIATPDIATPDLAILVDLTAQLIGLELDSEYRPGVIANLERTAAIAKQVMEFPLPDQVESATTFQP